MLNVIKTLDNKDILTGMFGIEREGLRVNEEGVLSSKPHPKVFGDKINNPYITTDFSESQVELITPTYSTIDETYKFLCSLFDITALSLEDEYIWPQSMPCNIPSNMQIPIADFSEDEEGEIARLYRERLLEKYGGKKQLISGIHYNFSFNEKIIETLYNSSTQEIEYKEFRNEVYLKVTRNYLRYRWILIYLLGGTTTIHESYEEKCVELLEKISEGSFTNDGAISYRNGDCGYKNHVDLFPDYYSVNGYIESIGEFIDYGIIDSHKELYSQIRLKAKDNKNLLTSLINEGINYLEIRSIDINPFDKAGISLEDLRFVHLFTLFLLVTEESDYENWQQEGLYNQKVIAIHGQRDVELLKDGSKISKKEWGLAILNNIKGIIKELHLDGEEVIDTMVNRLKDHKLTYAYRITEEVKKYGYINAHINLAKKYYEMAYDNRFKLDGYEDLELSTQILMKEAIKRGIKVDVVDRSDNFISLKKKNHVEYVKQATKTSKDNYVTVLIMENKVVTKQVLKENNIRVPKGEEYDSLKEAERNSAKYVGKSIVVKPKSTNFGTGISIFPNAIADEADVRESFKIAFNHDNTVLVEEFIKGKEYRFLVIDDEVVGILHRVPANVIGDGKKSIKELVELKNKDSLRGKGYRTPLEKIELDDNAKLFLKQRDLDINYIPQKAEIIYLRENSNISTGGDSIDFTEHIPKRFKEIAIECSKAVNAKICGVDMIIRDYEDENSEYGIIELNFNPAIHIHSYPYKGKERNIAKHILKLLEFN